MIELDEEMNHMQLYTEYNKSEIMLYVIYFYVKTICAYLSF